METLPRNIRLPRELQERLLEYCARSDRRPADVIRSAVRLLLADGHDEAERRIAAGVWQPQAGKPSDRDREAAASLLKPRKGRSA